MLIVILGLTAFSGTGISNTAMGVLGESAVMLTFLAVAMRYVLPALLDRLDASSGLLVLFAVSWAVALAAACLWPPRPTGRWSAHAW